ncbi:4-alpha-glucanotransferase [Candidatus Magnetominusculus xianensis]|uniref:4-alpha-glucanotransferase n=1 Tax=Candidatus Magnetominusculus xianensis TaxID=1748249 RepID=A0ABR5SGQ0_9BACT|nr:4-alpha-glucanotransferase [Candidatus Magnetominusculus xianensis]KWT90158.1 4-alpha-glucanotransferase [Candidatus Magnetominusculus xianensis]MBF0403651.1 4-alpha-glucanotransferase [Nitrospirota bacterium]
MKFGGITRFLTGVAIPVFSIRTEEGCGVGEFLDLIKMGSWCQKSGVDVIQILPVNDTGADSSPYNAISAFALHPIYVRLMELTASVKVFKEEYKEEINAATLRFNALELVDYQAVRQFKEQMLKKIYEDNIDSIKKDKTIKTWLDSNQWVKHYAVYRCLKDINNQNWWKAWSTLKDPKAGEIDAYWDDQQDDVMFYAWVQFELEKQLKKAAQALEFKGLRLKGDIPIMINEDSADVWAQRKYFDLSMRAGAPPDMFSESGQNWGFPCYNWEVLEKEDYQWWRQRLKQASKFYHAYRIDHVLGFFRIWGIPEKEKTGILGYFAPAVQIKKADLIKYGFDEERIKTFVHPVFTRSYVTSLFGNASEGVINKYFETTATGHLAFISAIEGERAIAALPEDHSVRDKLTGLYHNRILLDAGSGYLPTWYYYRTMTFNNMNDDERRRIRELVEASNTAQEDLWRINGKKLLSMMCETTDMLVCAEDLGAIPKCVPGVLEELKILGLKVERWARDYDKHNSPYIDTYHYPRLSVCSPSVHDTSTLRGWWEEANWDRNQYYYTIGMHGECPKYLTTELAEKIIWRSLNAGSTLTILLFQDLLSLYYNLRTKDHEQERVNVPGTVTPKNWAYRMKDNMDKMINYDEYNSYLSRLIEERRRRSF